MVGTKILLGNEMMGADLILSNWLDVQIIVPDRTSLHKPISGARRGRSLHFRFFRHLSFRVSANRVKSIERGSSSLL